MQSVCSVSKGVLYVVSKFLTGYCVGTDSVHCIGMLVLFLLFVAPGMYTAYAVRATALYSHKAVTKAIPRILKYDCTASIATKAQTHTCPWHTSHGNISTV